MKEKIDKKSQEIIQACGDKFRKLKESFEQAAKEQAELERTVAKHKATLTNFEQQMTKLDDEVTKANNRVQAANNEKTTIAEKQA